MSENAHAVQREIERWQTDTSDNAAWDARALVDQLRKSGDRDIAVEFGELAVKKWPAFEPFAALSPGPSTAVTSHLSIPKSPPPSSAKERRQRSPRSETSSTSTHTASTRPGR